MSAELIRTHFLRFLGCDVGVSFVNPENPHDVILYRPDRLPDEFVTQAFEAFKAREPSIARNIDRLLVSYDGPFGRLQCRVTIATADELPRASDVDAPSPPRSSSMPA